MENLGARFKGKETAAAKTRILSDAEFIKGGAEVGPSGEIHPTEKQMDDLQGRLQQAEETIDVLEGNLFRRDFEALEETGKELDREMAELHSVVESLEVQAGLISGDAVHSKKINEAYAQDYLQTEQRFLELASELQAFFSELQKFVGKYGINKVGGLKVGDMRTADLPKKIGSGTESLDELLDAILQARDADLYRAYKERQEITGSM